MFWALPRALLNDFVLLIRLVLPLLLVQPWNNLRFLQQLPDFSNVAYFVTLHMTLLTTLYISKSLVPTAPFIFVAFKNIINGFHNVLGIY